MPKLTIVKEVEDQSRVFFGAWVTLEDEDGEEKQYRIVGADEFDQHESYITVDAPLSKLLLGKTLDDEIKLEKEGEVQYFVVTQIEYSF